MALLRPVQGGFQGSRERESQTHLTALPLSISPSRVSYPGEEQKLLWGVCSDDNKGWGVNTGQTPHRPSKNLTPF